MRAVPPILVLASVLSFCIAAQPIQKPKPKPKAPSCDCVALQAELESLRGQLASVKIAKDSAASQARTEAIASLRAVQSALDAGANLELFRKYQVESRVKIDSLPDTPENAPLREVSGLFRDAQSFGITRITGTVDAGLVERAKGLLVGDRNALDALGGMHPEAPEGYHGPNNQLNQLEAQIVENHLFLLASKKLAELK